MRRVDVVVAAMVLVTAGCVHAEPFVAVRDGKAVADIAIEITNEAVVEPGGLGLPGLRFWLPKLLEMSTGAALPVTDRAADRPAIVIALAQHYPDVAKRAGFAGEHPEAHCIVSTPRRLYILGTTPYACRHGVATLLRELGFRFFNPSPRWWIVPQNRDLIVDVSVRDEPALFSRTLGEHGDLTYALYSQYWIWLYGNRTTQRTSFDYGNLTHTVNRNQTEFEAHPEYYATLPDGTRDLEQIWYRRKFCYSNPGFLKLVVADRIKRFEELRAKNPLVRSVGVNNSGGYGTCHCEDCKRLGTPSDRYFHLVNTVARAVRKEHPDAWVSLYATETHITPPTIDVEPNVHAQISMGYNRTHNSIPELVEKWSGKVNSIGIRDYYATIKWDWGMPGRSRGGRTAYFQRWVPYYVEKGVTDVLGKFHANWGEMTLGHYIGTQMLWDPDVDVDALTEEFLALCFGDGKEPMRRLYEKLDAVPPLTSHDLLAMFRDVDEAYGKVKDEAQRIRVVDMMMYLHYALLFRDVAIERDRTFPLRGDAYYAAVERVMAFTFDHLYRDMVHHYNLGYLGLCGRLAVQDGRDDFVMDRTGTDPVWRRGKPYEHTQARRFDDPVIRGSIPDDEEVVRAFRQDLKRLSASDDYRGVYSPILDWVTVGNGVIAETGPQPVTELNVQGGMTGWLSTDGTPVVGIELTPKAVVSLQVSHDDYSVLKAAYWTEELCTVITQQFEKGTGPQDVEIEMRPKPADYRFTIVGDCRLRLPKDTPLVVEASWARPLRLGVSGPLYFYVPKGNRKLVFACDGWLTIRVPGEEDARTFTARDRARGKDYVILDVPEGAAGSVWCLEAGSEGLFGLYNAPACLSPWRDRMVVPIDIVTGDDLDMGWASGG